MIPQISIIIPAYNTQAFIRDCINSIPTITDNKIEVLIVDDGSTDDTSTIVRSIIQNRPEAHLITKPNGGVSSARNLGLDVARGKYILFLDADDQLFPGFIENLIELLKDNFDVVFFKRYYKTRNTPEFEIRRIMPYLTPVSGSVYKATEIKRLLNLKVPFSGSGEFVIRRELTAGIRFDCSRSILEDLDFGLKVLTLNPELCFYNSFSTLINDEVPESLTKKRIQFRPRNYLAKTNTYLQSESKLRRKLYWLEAYFDIKRLSWFDRLKHLFYHIKDSMRNASFNRYMAGYYAFIFGINLNGLRKTIKRII